jgi:hypothetical protein
MDASEGFVASRKSNRRSFDFVPLKRDFAQDDSRLQLNRTPGPRDFPPGAAGPRKVRIDMRP